MAVSIDVSFRRVSGVLPLLLLELHRGTPLTLPNQYAAHALYFKISYRLGFGAPSPAALCIPDIGVREAI